MYIYIYTCIRNNDPIIANDLKPRSRSGKHLVSHCAQSLEQARRSHVRTPWLKGRQRHGLGAGLAPEDGELVNPQDPAVLHNSCFSLNIDTNMYRYVYIYMYM